MVRILILQDDRTLKQKAKGIWKDIKELWVLFTNSAIGRKCKKYFWITVAVILTLASLIAAIR